jgi:hypothetical protein
MTAAKQQSAVDRATLTTVVRVATEQPRLELGPWQTTLLSNQGRRSIWRFAGVGRDGMDEQPWSLILKEIRAPEQADAHDNDMRDWAYWPRESLLYEAGVPSSLAGPLRAPRCFGVMEPAPPLRWIWLEGIHDRYNRTWPLERYALAARHLGAFNGAYLVGKPLPTAPWLTDNGLRSRSAAALADFNRLRTPALWEHPLLRQSFSRPVLDDLERLAAERERLLAAAARLPQTFCHLDAWHGNMAAVAETSGDDVTVLFDWALAGYGALGGEISNLVWSSLLEFKLDINDAERLEAEVVVGYLRGLADVGWRGDPRQVRCAYLISSVLLFGLVPEAVDHALSEGQHLALEQHYGWPLKRMVRQAAEVTSLLLERADELRNLFNELSLA